MKRRDPKNGEFRGETAHETENRRKTEIKRDIEGPRITQKTDPEGSRETQRRNQTHTDAETARQKKIKKRDKYTEKKTPWQYLIVSSFSET